MDLMDVNLLPEYNKLSELDERICGIITYIRVKCDVKTPVCIVNVI